MSTQISREQVHHYVRSIDLSDTPRDLVAQDAAADSGQIFDASKAQAQVVGSSVLAFTQGVAAETREAISDSALFAQLVANKHVAASAAPTEWFTKYTEVLQNIGWVLQEGAWSDYTASGTSAQVHKKIIEILPAVLGPSAAAVAIVTSVVNALSAMEPDSPWITLFNRESQKAKIGRFQIGVVETQRSDAPDAPDDIYVSLMACLIEAQTTITKILFFEFKKARATFRANGTKVSINRPSLVDLTPIIRNKVRAYQLDYVSSIQNI